MRDQPSPPQLNLTTMENLLDREFMIELAQERSERTEEMRKLLLDADVNDWDQIKRREALMGIIQYIRWGEEGLFEYERTEGVAGRITQAIQ